MKIYTRKGDEGKTSLIGGTRVSKSHLRIDAYGTVDELNSYLGLVRDLAENEKHTAVLVLIQDRLFTIGSLLAADPEKSKMKLPEVTATDITFLEEEIDKMDTQLPEMRHFILPGGNPAVSACHIARCICRRAERLVVLLNETAPVEPIVLQYLNRLSDFLFVLARLISKEKNALETPWIPKM